MASSEVDTSYAVATRTVLLEAALGSAAIAIAAWDMSSRIASRPGRTLVLMGLPECCDDAASAMRESFSPLALALEPARLVQLRANRKAGEPAPLRTC